MKTQLKAVCLVLSGVLAGYAQETRSTIFGRVLDPQTAAVAGASVVVTNIDTNAVTRLRSNETGYYEASLLLPGNYQVAAEMQGFKRTVRTGIVLSISSRVEIDLLLAVGETAETISVSAEAPLLETSSVSAGRIMENRGRLCLNHAQRLRRSCKGPTLGLDSVDTNNCKAWAFSLP